MTSTVNDKADAVLRSVVEQSVEQSVEQWTWASSSSTALMARRHGLCAMSVPNRAAREDPAFDDFRMIFDARAAKLNAILGAGVGRRP